MIEYIINEGENAEFHKMMELYYSTMNKHQEVEIGDVVRLIEQRLCFEYSITNLELQINKVKYLHEIHEVQH